ncbi:MAG: formylmethanofuran dehydrogenase [Methanomicrobiales archaeon]|nr:formylmethanofuran dehydrogenase [Methanomicrobiales archaeon]
MSKYENSSGIDDIDGPQETGNPAILPFSEVIRFHGHYCAGVTLGYCASKIALQELRAGRDVDEQLIAIVENDACGIDAIQAVTGCTLGKGNLIFRDHGKHVYTFINRVTGDAVRISLKDRETDDTQKALQARVREGTASPEEREALKRLQQEKMDRMLVDPPEDYFNVKRVKVEIPEKARLFGSVKCSKCGEMVAESRARVQNGDFVCIPCFDEYTRGW